MGLLHPFIEVIEWVDDSQDTIVYRFPVQDKEIKMGAKLTVRESQTAVFINEGKVADTFGPGLYTLSTQNLPVLTTLRSWAYGFHSPFKAEVYFINTRQFTEQKWGTENPIMLRDAEFGMLRLRAFGIYSFRVGDPLKFLQQVSGTNGYFDVESIAGQLKRAIVSGLTDLLGELKIPALDLASKYDEIGQSAALKLNVNFEALGLELVSFFVENISLPQEVEQMLDKRTEMGVLGNIQQYAQFQAADSIKDLAKNPGGIASVGMGLGAGAAMGATLFQTFSQQLPPAQPAQPAPQQPPRTATCASCGASVDIHAKFCPECGKTVEPQASVCVKCGAALKPGAKFCSECGAPQATETLCKSCGNTLDYGIKFCPHCGTKVE